MLQPVTPPSWSTCRDRTPFGPHSAPGLNESSSSRLAAAKAGLGGKLFLLVGVNPLRSAKSARWMRSHLFGTIIPDALIARLERAADPATEGRRICVEVVEELSTVPGIAGVHVMAPGNDAAVPKVIAEIRRRVKRTAQ